MYTFRSLHCPENPGECPPDIDSVVDLINAGMIAHTGLIELGAVADKMIILCSDKSDAMRQEFDLLKQNFLTVLDSSRYAGSRVFDGHIDIDVVFSGCFDDSVRIRIPDLLGKLRKFQTNYTDIARCDYQSFAKRKRCSESAHPYPDACVQGVRLNTFLPRTAHNSSLAVINSLSCLTGLHVSSFGNAIVAPRAARETGMPLPDGCITLNDTAVAACDGNVAHLVEQINRGSDEHGVFAVGEAGEPLTLIALSGRDIEFKVNGSSASLLSGYPQGVSKACAHTGGLTMWLSFRRLHSVRFDSEQTARMIMGTSDHSVALKPGLFEKLSIDTPLEERLALFVLQVVRDSIIEERHCLSTSLTKLRQLLESSNSKELANCGNITKNELIGPDLPSD